MIRHRSAEPRPLRPFLALVVPLLLATPGVAQTPDEMARTAAYVASLQNPDGGFAATPGAKSSLGATNAAIKSLRFNGGAIPDVLACIRYVQSCRDAESGGFAPEPGGKPAVAITASGLMAMIELKLEDKDATQAALRYLAKNARNFEEVRIAVAGFEAAKATDPVFERWSERIQEDRNADGTFGEGGTEAFDTGSKVVALLRMGVKVGQIEDVLESLRQGQMPDGGWSKDGKASDLGSSYRIMRAFFMLKEKPDLGRLRSYLAQHRLSNGGYSARPGGEADLTSIYFCSIMLYWARLLEGEQAVVETAGFRPLFNGKDLTGWEGESQYWSARDGLLVGKSDGLDHNTFLATESDSYNFVLKVSFKLVGAKGNSGIQFRSVRVPGTEMRGYQADIGEDYWGCLYDESRRNKVLAQASENAIKALNPDGWNHYVIRAFDDQITLTLNGVTSVSYREPDAEIARTPGKIAVQIHSGGPMEVQFKDILIQPLPTIEASADAPRAQPGFEAMTVATDDGPRGFTVYWPEGYDPEKTYPAVLFLHGSGERGTDGKVSAYVGLGGAIAGRPGSYPMIAIFPQARETWRADSADARAALAALDAVSKVAKIDPDRVYLTGLSMGGAGAWSIAAAHPDRFAALVPVCGRGEPATAATIKHLPTWVVVGDADRDPTVLNAREMVRALRDQGNEARYSEYRGVGHNSWDRAYSDLALIEWMLQQKRVKN